MAFVPASLTKGLGAWPPTTPVLGFVPMRDWVFDPLTRGLCGFLLVATVALLPFHLNAQNAQALDVTDGCGSQFVGGHLLLLEDEQGSLTIEEVTRPALLSRFEPSESDKPNFGFTDSAYWARLELVNRGPDPVKCLLELDYPSIDTVALYVPQPSGDFDVLKLGDQEPFEDRIVKSRNPIFELIVQPQSAQTYTLRFSTEGSLQFPLLLQDVFKYFRNTHEQQIFWGILTGLMLVMALYNLFLFFSVRDRTYLAYTGLVVSYASFLLSMEGVLYEYLLHDLPRLATRSSTVPVVFAGLFGTVFTAHFLKIRSQGVALHRMFKGIFYFILCLVPIAMFAPYQSSAKVVVVSTIIWFIPITSSTIYVWKARGYTPARFFLFGLFAFLVGSTIYGLRILGLVPNSFFTTHSIHLGSAAMVMLFSFALADRIKLLKEDKNEALSARVLEHKWAEAAQKEAAQAWQSTFDAIGSFVCLLDRQGLVLRANQAALDLLERTDKDILHKPLSALLKEASGSVSSTPPPGFDSGLERVESFIEFKNKWYSFRRDPICGADDTVIGSVYVMADVTAQKELEEQLFQAQKMDAIGRLAGGVAHDFNNLLSVILSYGEFLVESATDADAKADAQEIVKAGNRAAALTAQLLAFSRKQVVRPALLHPSDVISDLSKMLSRLIGENYKLSLELTPKFGRIFFPKVQLEQILVNLVVNARDALPANGEVAIQTDWVTLETPRQTTTGELPRGRYLSLCVRDSGKGMDAATAARIFEPFFTTKGPGKGTGLGLAMVYGCTHQAGGAIDVLSAKGKGTRMTVYLPSADESAAVSSQPPVWAKTQGSGQRVLVVEDEAPVAAVIRKILSAAGYHVLEASSAEAALELLDREAQPMDYLLTDIVMSGMTGLELGAKVATLFPTMKVVYMSGYGFEALSQHGIDPASIHLLAKPFTREELLGTLMGQRG